MQYVREEEMKREVEREKRDREFWVVAFGGKVPEDDDVVILEDSMSSSALLRG